MAETLVVEVGSEQVTGLLYRPELCSNPPALLILGHGAGVDQTSGFMTSFANGLASRGVDVFTFNFLYTEQGRKTPDRQDRLLATYRAAIATVRRQPEFAVTRLLLGGKSMGGRIASQLAPDVSEEFAGLVFLGYPLHPPGKPTQVRSDHMGKIRAPMLFVQGSRDAFGSPDELRQVIRDGELNAQVFAVEGGDHSFKVRGKTALEQQAIYEVAQDEIASWIQKLN